MKEEARINIIENVWASDTCLTCYPRAISCLQKAFCRSECMYSDSIHICLSANVADASNGSCNWQNAMGINGLKVCDGEVWDYICFAGTKLPEAGTINIGLSLLLPPLELLFLLLSFFLLLSYPPRIFCASNVRHLLLCLSSSLFWVRTSDRSQELVWSAHVITELDFPDLVCRPRRTG